MSRNVIETVMGAVVLIIAAVFLFFAYSTSQVRAVSGYTVTAKFDRIEGIRQGGDVRISGIKVGNIVSEALDPTSYLAIVKLSIDPTIKLPEDSVAEILSSSLLGDKYLAVVPGSADAMIQPGGEIKYTQSPVSLEDLIGKYIFNAGAQNAGGQPPQQSQPQPNAGNPPSLQTPAPAPPKTGGGEAAPAK